MNTEDKQMYGDMRESLGRIESKIDGLHTVIKHHDRQIDELSRFQNNTRGGLKFIGWVAGLGGSAAAFIAWAKGLLPTP